MAAAVHEHAHLRGAGLHGVERNVVRPVPPARRPQPGTKEGLLEVTVKAVAPGTRGHEHDIRDGSLAGLKARGQRDVDVRRPKVGLGAAGVQVLARLVGLHVHRLGPVQEILAGRTANGPAALVEPAEVTHVKLLGFRPKGPVLRIKASLVLGDHGLLPQQAPSQAVGRRKRLQPAGTVLGPQLGPLVGGLPAAPVLRGITSAAQGLVALVGGGGGVGIDERRKVVRHQKGIRPHVHHHVALGHLRHVVQAQLRLYPVYASVLALGIERHLPLVVFPPALAPMGSGHLVAPVVKPQPVAILQHRGIMPKGPRRHTPQLVRTVHLQLRPVQLPDQQVVDEQFPPRADLHRLHSGKHNCKPCKNHCYEKL